MSSWWLYRKPIRRKRSTRLRTPGQTLFGESRVQEAKVKIPLLPGRLRWHFIGHLQKNKIRAALPMFEMFHSVDSLDTARQFQRIAEEDGLRPRVLLEVNVAGESSKFGFSPAAMRLAAKDFARSGSAGDCRPNDHRSPRAGSGAFEKIFS